MVPFIVVESSDLVTAAFNLRHVISIAITEGRPPASWAPEILGTWHPAVSLRLVNGDLIEGVRLLPADRHGWLTGAVG